MSRRHRPSGAGGGGGPLHSDPFAAAVALLRAGRVEEAEAGLRHVVAARPDHADAHHCLGVIAGRRGDHAEAARRFAAAVAIDATVFAYHHALGIALHQSGRLEEAAASLVQAVTLAPGDAGAHGQLGDVLAALGWNDEAEKCYETALALDPDRIAVHRQLGTLCLAAGRFAEAERHYRRVLAAQPESAEIQGNLGAALLGQGQTEAARDHFHRALALAPGLASAHLGLGTVLSAEGDPAGALDHFRRALALAPDYPEAWLCLGNAQTRLDRFVEAQAAYKSALLARPGYAAAHRALGMLYLRHENRAEAVAHLKAALAAAPDDGEARCVLCHVLIRQEEYAEAAEQAEAALARQPDSPVARTLRAILKGVEGHHDEAIALAGAAVAETPDSLEARIALATILAQAGRFADAIVAIRPALDLDGDDPRPWLLYGSLLEMRQVAAGQDAAVSDDDDPPGEAGPAWLRARHRYFLRFECRGEAGPWTEAVIAALPPEPALSNPAPVAAPAPPLPSRAVGLLVFGRSGTALLNALVDGHPEVSVVPGHILQGYFCAETWPRLTAAGWRGLPERFAEIYAVLFDSRAQAPIPGSQEEDGAYWGVKRGLTGLGEGRDEWLTVDRDRFCAEARAILAGMATVDPRSFLKVVHLAYERALGQGRPKDTLLYHIHNPKDYAALNFMRHYPDARFVMMVREPIASCESWLRSAFLERRYNGVAGRILHMLQAVNRLEVRRHPSVGVRLEDLKARPRATMRALCGWMGIAEDPCLFHPTAQGKTWWHEYMAPVPAVAQLPPSLLGERDRLILRTLLHPFMVRFGYADPDPDGFRRDLDRVRPWLDEPLEVETCFCAVTGTSPDEVSRRLEYRFLHAHLRRRWMGLDRFGTYPDMVAPLVVVGGEEESA